MLAGEQTVAGVFEVLGRRRGNVHDVVGIIREQLGVRAEAARIVLGADVLLGEGLRAAKVARADGCDAVEDVRGAALGCVDLQREYEALGDVAGPHNAESQNEAGGGGHGADSEPASGLKTRREPTSQVNELARQSRAVRGAAAQRSAADRSAQAV